MKILLIALLLIVKISFGQNIILEGTVDDKNTGSPLPYAYVLIKDKALGTVTNSDGYFTLKVASSLQNETVVFSYVGYKSQEFRIGELQSPIKILLKADTKLLHEVIIEPKKMISAKALLKKVIKNIPNNYLQDTVLAKGYYRELLKENGVYIKYADAVVEFNEIPYDGEHHKYKAFDFGSNNIMTMGFSSFYGGDRLHRYHYFNRTFKKEDAKIIDSRSSDNLTSERMDANIEGGPLNLIGRDRIKYLEEFMRSKNSGKFNFTISEVKDSIRGWEYVLHFSSTLTKEKLAKKTARKKKFRGWLKSAHFLEGDLYVDQENFAVTRMSYHVPQHLKQYICGYDTMAIKHFDFKIDLAYEETDNKYNLTYVRMEDEFLFNDSIEHEITPYSAVSELFINSIGQKRAKSIPKDSLFINSDFNHLFDHPLTYNQEFWHNYMLDFPQYNITNEVRKEMEIKKPLERQFADKHKKDMNLAPPVAKIIPHEYKIHGKTYTDDYAWLKDTTSPLYNNEVMEYIDAENKYAKNYFIPLRGLERIVYREMLSHIAKEYVSLPSQIRNYKYYVEYGYEEEYPVYYRTKVNSTKKEVLIDAREGAKKYDYYTASSPTPSPSDNMISFYENTTGSSKVVLKFKNLLTGEVLNDSIVNSVGSMWLTDDKIIYIEQEKKTNRTYIARIHTINTPQRQDKILYQENDPRFSIGIYKNKAKDFVFLSTGSATTSEGYYFRSAEENPKLKLAYPREKGIVYNLDQADDKFFIFTNDKAKNFRVVSVDTSDFAKENWQEILPEGEEHLLVDFDILKKYFIVTDYDNAQPRVRIIDRVTGKVHKIKFKKDIYQVSAWSAPVYDMDSIRISYSTAATPNVTYSYHIPKQEKTVLKTQKLPNPVNKWGLKIDRVMVEARDGEEIPMTLIYKKYVLKRGLSQRKAYITSYGSYGAPMNIGFSSSQYALLDRGFVIAIPHIRGGSEKGYGWYEDGKMLNKRNTFNDFIDCTQYLIDEEYASKGNIVAQGASAGGLLMGAVANMAPDLYKLIVLDVPFVDVINTMLDDKLPLTTGEYEEWGNPNIKKEFKYIQTYSPYENVKAQKYPNLLFTTGLSDQQVGYWEPAKMVAKLRATKTDTNEMLLFTELHSGHGGPPGRFDGIRKRAKQYAFIIDLFLHEDKKESATKN